jgi:hypothetical protein
MKVAKSYTKETGAVTYLHEYKIKIVRSLFEKQEFALQLCPKLNTF